jgi:hypothetical protein
LTDFPFGDSTAQRFNSANHFMPRDAWQLQTRIGAGDDGRIGMTDSAGFNPDQNLALAGLWNWFFNKPKLARRCYLDCFVCLCHCRLSGES